jgi:hypothetical protein
VDGDGDKTLEEGFFGEAILFCRSATSELVVEWTSPGMVSLSTRVRPSSCGLRVFERRLKSVSVNLNTDLLCNVSDVEPSD